MGFGDHFVRLRVDGRAARDITACARSQWYRNSERRPTVTVSADYPGGIGQAPGFDYDWAYHGHAV